VLDSGASVGTRELSVRSLDRELRLDCRASRLDSHSGVLLELTDTTRQSNIRRESELLEQLKTSRRIIRQLAHEVKNPLGGMRGAAQLLERRLDTDELRRYTQIIIAEADRLAAVVDSALTPGGTRTPTRLNVHRITEHVVELLRAEAPRSVQIDRDYDPSVPEVVVDEGQLIQAVLNIARNALHAVGEEGHLRLRTRVRANFTIGQTRHRLVASIEVEDDGPGIPEELQQNVFYPLVTSKVSGSGIGLTVAQELIAGNGGLVEFESRPGCTVFKVRLPIASAEVAP
jgi:two-component system nitrogen regulation sensor histidine kinase GlnL